MPVRVHTFRGAPAVTLHGGDHAATFLPELGMLGVSLRWRGAELLSLHGGLDAWRGGHTTGMPLLAPWANRLAERSFRVGRTAVVLGRSRRVHVDANGLPIHGLLVGAHRWTVDTVEGDDTRGLVRARYELTEAVWPFPHRIDVTATVDERGLTVETGIVPTTRRSVPVSFGWHPYFRIPGVTRRELVVHLPSRSHLVLDERHLPTGVSRRESAARVPLADTTFDDGYRLGRERLFVLVGGELALDVTFDRGYRFAQVYAPAGRAFVAIEPMTAPTNALLTSAHPTVAAGDRYAASFTVRARPS